MSKSTISVRLELQPDDNATVLAAAARLSARIGGRVSKTAFIERLIAKAIEAERKAQQQESGQ